MLSDFDYKLLQNWRKERKTPSVAWGLFCMYARNNPFEKFSLFLPYYESISSIPIITGKHTYDDVIVYKPHLNMPNRICFIKKITEFQILWIMNDGYTGSDPVYMIDHIKKDDLSEEEEEDEETS